MSIESREVTVSRVVPASPETVFRIWTNPDHVKKWWGPKGVECLEAEVDLRVGGQYRIANRFTDGTVAWIHGEFKLVEPPHKLQYSWGIGLDSVPIEQVTVSFNAVEGGTEVVVFHQNAPDAATNESHNQGWVGCLSGLDLYVAALPACDA